MSRRGLLLVLASTALAHANGRPPFTNGVYFQANDNQSIYVRTTFGLLISHDGGCSFRWTCEDSIGYGGTYDPEYAIGSDGSLYATTYTGLRISRDGGCTYATELTGRYVASIDLGSTGDVWAVTSDGAMPNVVVRSVDGGNTFGSAGMPASSLLWNSVKVAPSDPMTVYVTGYELGSGAHVYSTVNAGSAWTDEPLAGLAYGQTPVITIAAVDPTNAMNVFAVSVGASPPGDLLYRSTDGGATFTQVLATTQPIANVVDTDGTNVVVAGGTGGSFRSTDNGATFTALTNAPQLLCLGKRPDGTLVGCGTNFDPDNMAVAATSDMTTWTKVFRFVELDGVVDCPAGTVDHDDCDVQMWPMIAEEFGVTGPSCAGATDVPIDAAMTSTSSSSGKSGCAGTDGAPIGVAVLALIAAAGIAGYRKRRQV
jgi:MYXO-CTERM domain-containing protein